MAAAARCRMEIMHENKYPVVNLARDPRFLTLRSLQTSQGRSRTALYVIEGIRHLARAVEHHAPIESLFLDLSVLSNPFGQKLARRLRQRGVPGVRLSNQLYRDLTLASEPQGIGAVVRQQWTPLSQTRSERNSLWLAVESIESPGNLGTIIRTAEAAGVTGIFVLGADCDPYDPATIRATMGSLFSQQLVRCSLREFTDWARSRGVAIVGSSPAGLLDYKAIRYSFPNVLVIGSEKRGLSEQMIEVANFLVRIPMRGECDSINAAVAAGVLLFEMSNQRRES
jgi:TrmH family RNA methyltransferase